MQRDDPEESHSDYAGSNNNTRDVMGEHMPLQKQVPHRGLDLSDHRYPLRAISSPISEVAALVAHSANRG